jgi:hypothetical protein
MEDSIDKMVRQAKGGKGQIAMKEMGVLDDLNKMVKDPLKKAREEHPLKDAAGFK